MSARARQVPCFVSRSRQTNTPAARSGRTTAAGGEGEQEGIKERKVASPEKFANKQTAKLMIKSEVLSNSEFGAALFS